MGNLRLMVLQGNTSLGFLSTLLLIFLVLLFFSLSRTLHHELIVAQSIPTRENYIACSSFFFSPERRQ